MRKKRWASWISWGILTVLCGGYLTYALWGQNEGLFVTGRTSDGHYQIELACDACHAKPFGGGTVLHEACLECHGEELKTAGDSHPKRLFTDPRNADRVAAIDAKRCVTCHQEHRPGMTRVMGVTIADDHCMLCHARVRKERPSHRDFPTTNCATGGCHNYHDNSALYEDFLIKHLDHAATFPRATLPSRDLGAVLLAMGEPPRPPLGRAQQDAPLGLSVNPRLLTAWSVTAHARGGVNCTDCHGGQTASDKATPWQDKPGANACRECHESEADGFERGKHGMRLKHDLSPMTPELARQPMKGAAAHKDLTCNSCHRAHRYDTKWAAVAACTGCHDDRHTRAYRRSPHERLWQREITRENRPGGGVSCATCHLPREISRRGGQSFVRIQHNQNQNLRPNEKMARGVCLTCHGLGFTLDALADRALIDKNFNGQPKRQVRSLEMAEERNIASLKSREKKP
ncbi:MAG: cytochrome c3 family protein [Gammaproteobacteria bacterium]